PPTPSLHDALPISRLHAAPACRKAGRARNAPRHRVIVTPAPGTPDSKANHETPALPATRPEHETARAPDLPIRWNGIRGINVAPLGPDSSVVPAPRAKPPPARRSR